MNEETMDFGGALLALKNGKSVARKNWDGVDMSIYLVKGSRDVSSMAIDVVQGDDIEGIPFELFELGDYETITRLPNLNMKNAHGRTVTGWLPSQTDVLAEDWFIVTQ